MPMAKITVNLSEDAFQEIQKAAARSGGLDKYFQDALGLAKLVDRETKDNDNIIAVADKNGKVLKTVKTSR